jgi:hypothetical protein
MANLTEISSTLLEMLVKRAQLGLSIWDGIVKRLCVGHATCTVPSVEVWPVMLLVGLPGSHETLILPTRRISSAYGNSLDRLCGIVVRVPGYRSRGPGATRFSEK